MTLNQLSCLVGTSDLHKMGLTIRGKDGGSLYILLLSQYLGKEPRVSWGWGGMKQKIWLKAGLLGAHHVLPPDLAAGEYIKSRIK